MLRKALSYIKVCKHAVPKSTKKIDNVTVYFALLESARLKAAHRMLMKLTPSVT